MRKVQSTIDFNAIRFSSKLFHTNKFELNFFLNFVCWSSAVENTCVGWLKSIAHSSFYYHFKTLVSLSIFDI